MVEHVAALARLSAGPLPEHGDCRDWRLSGAALRSSRDLRETSQRARRETGSMLSSSLRDVWRLRLRQQKWWPGGLLREFCDRSEQFVFSTCAALHARTTMAEPSHSKNRQALEDWKHKHDADLSWLGAGPVDTPPARSRSTW